MTESEAIKKHIEECECRIGTILGFMESNSDADISSCEENIAILKVVIIALEEVQKRKAKKSKRETYEDMLERLLLQYNISDYLLESVKDWLEYKIERNNFKYKEKGLNTLLRQISDTAKRNGDEAVANAIRQSIASGYQGIVWDKVSKGNQNRNSGGIDWSNV